MPLVKPKDGQEGFVDAPLLFRRDPAHYLAQSSGVYGADLLGQYAGGLA